MRGQKEDGDLRFFFFYGQNLGLNRMVFPLIVHYSRKNDFGKKKHCHN